MLKRLLILLLLTCLPGLASGRDFTLHKMESGSPGPTLLVIGGIHGDEPGGFNAAALLMTRYRIKNGNLWIIPNLNRNSILRRAHGWHGDMNYKFNGLSKNDPDYQIIQEIKQLINDPQVDLIFNLHDGSGYYHPQRKSQQQNPNRWGQSCVIDQAELPGTGFGNLEQFCEQATGRVNQLLLQPQHRFHVKNTQTASSDKVMQKALTYYALRNGKPAIGLEASKKLPTHQRVYYLLSALEASLQQVGIEYQRDFQLTPQAVKQALTKEILLSFGGGRISLPLTNMRPVLKYFPLEKAQPLKFSANNPLVSVQAAGKRFRIHFGNNRLAFLEPDYVDYDHSLNSLEIQVDGHTHDVGMGEYIDAKETFRVTPINGYRVNVIGYRHPQQIDESGLNITHKQLDSNYSVDNDGQIFRVEIYREDKFCGMLLVDFSSF